MERQGHVSEPTRLAQLRVQVMGHKAEIQEEEMPFHVLLLRNQTRCTTH